MKSRTLTQQQIEEVQFFLANRVTVTELCDLYQVSRPTITRIQDGTTTESVKPGGHSDWTDTWIIVDELLDQLAGQFITERAVAMPDGEILVRLSTAYPASHPYRPGLYWRGAYNFASHAAKEVALYLYTINAKMPGNLPIPPNQMKVTAALALPRGNGGTIMDEILIRLSPNEWEDAEGLTSPARSELPKGVVDARLQPVDSSDLYPAHPQPRVSLESK